MELEHNDVISPKKVRDIPDSELIDYEDDGKSLTSDMIDMSLDDSKVRFFIALFDYDPTTMSPNPDGSEEELTFKEGQLIKVNTRSKKRLFYTQLDGKIGCGQK